MLGKPLVLAERFESWTRRKSMPTGDGMVIAQIADDLFIGLYRDALRDKALPNQIQKGLVGIPAELNTDSGGKPNGIPG
jgi:hypothetical protein